MLDSLASELLPMKLRDRAERQHYEQTLQEVRKERETETKQVERLSAILVKKASSAKSKGLTGLLSSRVLAALSSAPVSLAPARRLTFPDQQQNFQNAAGPRKCDSTIKFRQDAIYVVSQRNR